ncbi:MAG: hypothetical protein JOZ51_07735 [Chloroflexi bacterium]|nr:hypothetical protein [Chloroflexota bacterium]
MKTIGFATYSEEPQLTKDDLLVVAALHPLSINVVPVVWDDPSVDLRQIEAVVIRSCWDYHLKPDRFLQWVDTLDQASIPVFNSNAIVRWNFDKHYLQELAAQGVAIPRTIWIEPGAQADLATILREHDLAEAVIKPTISLSAYQTWRISADEARAHQDAFAQLVAERGMMIQEFIPEVTTSGELSLMFFGKVYSHAVYKRPRQGDFRVQTDFGGTREIAAPPQSVIAQAQAIVDSIAEPLQFARVDGIEVEGRLVLMELELIDPLLFFSYDPAAAQRFAEVIAQTLEKW